MLGQTTEGVPHFEEGIEDKVTKAILGRDEGSTLAASRGASDEMFAMPPIFKQRNAYYKYTFLLN